LLVASHHQLLSLDPSRAMGAQQIQRTHQSEQRGATSEFPGAVTGG
jgi:hypothetical protein